MMFCAIFAIIAVIVCTVDGEIVAFSAALTNNQTFTSTETVVLDKIFTNIGGGYDASTGIFTCPAPGVYVLNFNALSEVNNEIWFDLFQNTNYVLSIYADNAQDYAGAANSIILQLAKGDTIHVQAKPYSENVNYVLHGDAKDIYTTFSGFRISAAVSGGPVGR